MASPRPKPKLSITEKIGFLQSILAIPIYIPFIALRHLIFPPANSPGVKRAVAQHILGSILLIPVQQQIAYLPHTPTGSSVAKFCAQAKPPLPRNSISLSHGAKLHIVGPSIEPSTNSKILLFFHGGGYLYPAGPTHIPFAYACSQAYSTSPSPVTLAVLEYTLSPVEPYPRQLKQAIAALNYLLTLTSPANIIILGDSAGAHLAISLVSHILHPAQDSTLELETVKLKKGERLSGLCLVSPLLSYDITKPSYTINASTDFISATAIIDSITNISPSSISLSQAFKHPQLNPGDASADHWVGLPAESVLVTIGEREVFYSSCLEFAEKLKESGANVKLEIGEGEWHDAPIVNQLFGLAERDGSTSRAITKWMSIVGRGGE